MKQAGALLAVAGLLVATFAGASLFAGPPRVQLSANPDAADHVTLYQNGLAFVQLARAFVSDGGETLLVFAMPLTGLFDSLKIEAEGVDVGELRSSLSASPLIHPGDRVVIHVEKEAYRGTVLRYEGDRLLLASGNSTTLVEVQKATAIEIEGRAVAESAPGSAEVQARVRAPAGNHTVRISYLARGPGWTPSYTLDLDTRHFTFDAVLSGLADWSNVTLDLVSGSPNIAYNPSSIPSYDADRAYAGSAVADLSFKDEGFAPSTPLGDLHRYHLQRPISLVRGETIRLPVLQGPIDVMRNFYSMEGHAGQGGSATAQPLTVRERIQVRNTLPEPLPPGLVRFYRNDTWVGEDALGQLPKNDTTNLTVSLASEVKGELRIEQVTPQGGSTSYTWALKATNLKGAPIDLHASISYPLTTWFDGRNHPVRDVRLDPPPTSEERPGTEIWDRELGAGQLVTFRLSFTATGQ